MGKHPVFLISIVFLAIGVSVASFKYGESLGESKAAQALDRKLTAAFTVQSVKLLVEASVELSEGNNDLARQTVVKHLGDSLYFVRQGVLAGDSAYLEILPSLCPRRAAISKIAAGLPGPSTTAGPEEQLNREIRRKLYADALAELDRRCAGRPAE